MFRAGLPQPADLFAEPLTLSDRIRLDRFGQEMPPFAVLDLDKPDIGIDPRGAFDIGVQVGFERGANRLHPEALAITTRRLAI